MALATNGWDEGHPPGGSTSRPTPDALVRLDRPWQRWAAVNPDLDGYAGRRTTVTPVVVLESRGS